jgi:L-rhamnose-H+ transport protein
MSGTLLSGLLLALASGVASGNAMLPLRFKRCWRWENIWLVFSSVALIAIPWALALCLLKGPWETYRSLEWRAILVPALLGAGWGFSHVLYGLTITRLGLALGSSIVMGLVAALGTVVPWIALRPAGIRSPNGLLLAGGVLLAAAGIITVGRAGVLRERSTPDRKRPHKHDFRVSLAFAIVCGLLSPMFNYAFAFGQAIQLAAVRAGNSPLLAGYAVWPVALMGGFLPNLAVCLYLLRRNRTWKSFAAPSPDAVLTLTMVALWSGSFALYGMSAALLGPLGTSAGWGITQGFCILAANISGILAGEWKNTPAGTRRMVWVGIAFLACGIALLSASNF